jgi:hypothetical protein
LDNDAGCAWGLVVAVCRLRSAASAEAGLGTGWTVGCVPRERSPTSSERRSDRSSPRAANDGWAAATSSGFRPKISCRKLITTTISPRNASNATPIEITTSNRLPATTPVTSSPIAMSTTDRTMPNRITLELRSRG